SESAPASGVAVGGWARIIAGDDSLPARTKRPETLSRVGVDRPETLVSGRNRKRACGVGGSCAGRAAAGEAGAANVEAIGSYREPRRAGIGSRRALRPRPVWRPRAAGGR